MKSDWISITRRLPISHDWVLVWITPPTGHGSVFKAHWNEMSERWVAEMAGGLSERYRVTHWARLPEGPTDQPERTGVSPVDFGALEVRGVPNAEQEDK